MEKYNHKEIEQKWQKEWTKQELYKTYDVESGEENEMVLVEFSYPSGDLHVGHWYAFAVTDIYARMRRMNGKNVMFPIGFDAFGLPAENAAIKRGENPRKWTYKNIETMTKQLEQMGSSFDWSRKVVTCDPEYYKWTQWLFLELYKDGAAYQAESPVNWCPSCKTVLANEQVVGGLCERCGSGVSQKKMKQWMLKITDRADDLIDDLDELPWSNAIKEAQKNWIGRNEGAEFEFEIKESDKKVRVFTTRPDTLYGVTYVVLAPEHDLVQELREKIKNFDEVEAYIKESGKKTELDRTSDQKEKTGVELKGLTAINPANGEEVPVWIADYVLANYATGSVMAVPAHDTRDYAFAKAHDLPIKEVISGGDISKEAYTESGKMVNSGEFDGKDSEEAKAAITEKAGGRITKTYRLRDWLVSRQRYWGCPIPIIHCEKCGAVPVPDDQLPVELPEIDDFMPRDDGKSPLAKAEKWMNVECPKCGAKAQRETDTLDTFVDSSWYFLRYTDPKNEKQFASKEAMAAWMPVEMYSGGAEHTTMHLLYSRYFQKALHKIDLVEDKEPYKNRLNRGIILGPDGNKMSKSKGNVINPDEIVERLGADTVRLYLAFIGPYNEAGHYPWDPNGVVGVRRFLERVWDRAHNYFASESSETAERELHKAIKKVTEDIDSMKMNTGISQMMIFMNTIEKEAISKKDFMTFLKLLSPYAPHISDELWHKLGGEETIHLEHWPEFDSSKIEESEVSIVIQINGKVRHKIEAPNGISEEEITKLALESDEVQKWVEGEPKKIIYIENKILNIVL